MPSHRMTAMHSGLGLGFGLVSGLEKVRIALRFRPNLTPSLAQEWAVLSKTT